MVKRKDNCLLFACRVLRYARTSDHLVIRRSHWGWFPHFSAIFELQDGTICKMEYVPDAARPRWIPPIFFNGHVQKTFYKRVSDGDSSV